jgi:hypothetical protein
MTSIPGVQPAAAVDRAMVKASRKTISADHKVPSLVDERARSQALAGAS